MNTVKDLISLKGRRALITGASGGLGRVMAEVLAELGADLVLIDRESSNFSLQSANLVESWGVKVEYHACDLEQEAQRSELIEKILNDTQGLNILFNNAAFMGETNLKGWSTPFEGQSIETWRRALEVNLTAVFHLCQGLMPVLKNGVGASIINVGSIYGMVGPDWDLYEGTEMGNPAGYGVAKGGLIQLTRWLATTVAPNVRVNTISPGGIFRGQADSFIKKYEAKTPLGRMAREDDFLGVVAFLASDLSRYVTGQNIVVDGGWSVW